MCSQSELFQNNSVAYEFVAYLGCQNPKTKTIETLTFLFSGFESKGLARSTATRLILFITQTIIILTEKDDTCILYAAGWQTPRMRTQENSEWLTHPKEIAIMPDAEPSRMLNEMLKHFPFLQDDQKAPLETRVYKRRLV
jgi:hypothetical protein